MDRNLYILYSNGEWKTADWTNSKFTPTYRFIETILYRCQGMGRSVDMVSIDRSYSENNVHTSVIKVESYRKCTIVYCKQYDGATGGLRYMVYATKYESNIGIDLESIDCKSALKFCPKDIKIRFLDE